MHLWVALLLEVRNDGLAHEVGRADDRQDLVVLAVDEGELEAVLGGVHAEDARLAVAVERVDRVALGTDDVQRLVEGADDAVVAVQKGVLDVVEGRVDEDAEVVPRAALDAHSLVQDAELLELAVADGDAVLGQEGHVVLVVGPDDVLDVLDSDLGNDLGFFWGGGFNDVSFFSLVPFSG